jgi:hypothetical protein
MRTRRALSALLLVLALAPASPAAAEWHIVPLVGLTFHVNTNASLVADTTTDPAGTVGTHINFGGSLALLGAGIVGVEAVGVFTPNLKADTNLVNANVQSSRALAVMGNVVLTTPRRWTEYSLRPYVSGGFGLMTLSVVDKGNASPSPPTTNTPGFDIGGGAIGFFSQHTGMRFDLRYYRRLGGDPQFVPTGAPQLSFWTASVGVVFRR